MKSYGELEAKKNHLKELEEIVANMPTKLNEEYNKGRKDATIEIEKENKYKTELLKKDFESVVARQNDKIETLKEEIEKIFNEKIALQEKLDHAYTQIKDMATKTVEATGGLKILGNNSGDIKA